MAERRITALFDTYEQAARAIRRLETSGIPGIEMSLVTNGAYETGPDREMHSLDENNAGGEMAGAGATVGTLLGGAGGLLAGLGTVAVPGFGPVVAAGWLVSTLVGAGAGAAVGSLAGALVGAGLSEEEARTYEEGIRQGGVLVVVRADEAEMGRVADILDDEGLTDGGERGETWLSDAPAPPIGAAASTTTGLITDLMLMPLDEDDDERVQVEMEDERIRKMTGTDREPT